MKHLTKTIGLVLFGLIFSTQANATTIFARIFSCKLAAAPTATDLVLNFESMLNIDKLSEPTADGFLIGEVPAPEGSPVPTAKIGLQTEFKVDNNLKFETELTLSGVGDVKISAEFDPANPNQGTATLEVSGNKSNYSCERYF